MVRGRCGRETRLYGRGRGDIVGYVAAAVAFHHRNERPLVVEFAMKERVQSGCLMMHSTPLDYGN